MVTRDKYIENLLNIAAGWPYGYGKWGEQAFDCSGVVSRCLGLVEKKNAQQLFTLFQGCQVPRLQALPGSLLFYGAGKDKINHVMTVLRHWPNGGMTLIGARGGDATTVNIDIAKEQKAFVDICFGDYWLDKFVTAVDPFTL